MASGWRAGALLAAGRGGVQLWQNAGRHQCLVGFGIELVDIPEHVLFEELEDDQLDLDLYPKAAAGLDEVVAECVWAERVALVIELLADQRIETSGQVPQRLSRTTHDFRDHGVDGYRLFQLIVLHK